MLLLTVAICRCGLHATFDGAGGETVNLGILDDGEAVYQSGRIPGNDAHGNLGSRSPAHASGVGKQLAHMSDVT